MLIFILIVSCIICLLGYRVYGRFLSKHCQLDDKRETPACTINDGVDYVPTRASVLFGHHFSSIAGAGPIVGPVLATLYFGIGPTWIWILLGCVFVGGVHDFGSMLMSVRNRGRSVAETTRNLVGENTARLFILFLIIALTYLIIVTLDLTANTFASTPEVATASGWFVIMAILFGLVSRRASGSLRGAILVFVPLTFLGLWVGNVFPAPDLGKDFWVWAVIVYCFAAATLPVNLLLQPRDFLSSTFLYAMLGLGFVGLFASNAPIQAPLFTGFFSEEANPGFLVPALFITVACGACSGFHSVVSSGTTSKQIRREKDICRVGYGSMLMEGILAIFAMATVAVLAPVDVQDRNAVGIFSSGAAVFLKAVGVPLEYGKEFTALTVSTFLLTSLDTCTRLCRFLLEELFDWSNLFSRYLGTAVVLLIPGLLAFQTFGGEPAWKAIWPLFGATNQLMAALALVTFIVYLKDQKIRITFAVIPAVIMLVTPVAALLLMAVDGDQSILLRLISLGMLVLGLFVSGMSFRVVFRRQGVERSVPVKG